MLRYGLDEYLGTAYETYTDDEMHRASQVWNHPDAQGPDHLTHYDSQTFLDGAMWAALVGAEAAQDREEMFQRGAQWALSQGLAKENYQE